MNYYHAILMRFQHYYHQLKCTLVFSAIALPVLATIIWVRPHTAVLFHTLLLAMGWLTWTFGEYMLHRFWQHKSDANQNRIILQVHLNHHLHPTEFRITAWQRIYMFLLLMASFIVTAYLRNYFTFVTGLCIGMVGYLYIHRFLHTKAAGKVFKRLFRYHIYHHCKYPDTCYGISTTLWDDLLGTVPPKTVTISPRVLSFYLSESK